MTQQEAINACVVIATLLLTLIGCNDAPLSRSLDHPASTVLGQWKDVTIVDATETLFCAGTHEGQGRVRTYEHKEWVADPADPVKHSKWFPSQQFAESYLESVSNCERRRP